MIRIVAAVCLSVGLLAGGLHGQEPEATEAAPKPAEPTVFELMIDGETFSVEGNRVVTLQSKQKPGETYQVAIRVAPVQRLRLENIQLDYDRTATPEKLDDADQPSARLRHELGFSMLITDLGAPLKPEARRAMLELLIDSVTTTYQQRGGAQVETTEPHQRKFEHSDGLGIVVRYRDTEGFEQRALIYVLQGERFAASVIVQYLEADREIALPLIKRTLDSIRAL